MGLFTVNAPAAKFVQVGDSVEGEIVEVVQEQRRKFVRGQLGDPEFWFNRKPVTNMPIDPATGKRNDPVLQYVITVDTGLGAVDGTTERRIFVKNKRMEDALKRAVRDAKAREGLLLGGRLKCTFTAFDETSDAPTPPKVYEFVYTAPAAGQGRQPSGEVRLVDRDAEVTQNLAPIAAPAPVSGGEGTGDLHGSHRSSPVVKKALGIPDDDTPPF